MRLPDLDMLVSVVMFTIFSVMVGIAASYTHQARLVPLVLGVPALLLAGWQLWRQISAPRRRVAEPVARPEHPSDDAAAGLRASTPGSEAAAVLWLLLFTSMVVVGGLVVGGTLGVMICQRVWLRESWRTTAAGGALAWLTLHGFFERGFGLPLHPGWIPSTLWSF